MATTAANLPRRGRNPGLPCGRWTSAIQPLTPERLPDLAALFGQGGDPKWCWCTYFRVRGRDWTNSTAEENRAVLTRAAEDERADGRAPGLVAYDGEAAVGWVSVGPRERLRAPDLLQGPRAGRRRAGLVDRVLRRRAPVARPGRRERAPRCRGGLCPRPRRDDLLEAYPVDVPTGDRIPSANVYHGTLAMFERAGFEVVAERLAPARPAPVHRPAPHR